LNLEKRRGESIVEALSCGLGVLRPVFVENRWSRHYPVETESGIEGRTYGERIPKTFEEPWWFV
jgi:hypothetical protein